LIFTTAICVTLFSSVVFHWPRDIREYIADPDQQNAREILQAIDRAKDGKELGAAINAIPNCEVKSHLVNKLLPDSETSKNRLVALILLNGLESAPIQAIYCNAGDRTTQTEVASLLAEVKPKFTPELENWFLDALTLQDQLSADKSYFLALCLLMAYQSDTPRAKPEPSGTFWRSLAAYYETHEDAGVHSTLRLLLTISQYAGLDKIEHALRESRSEKVVFLDLKKTGKHDTYPTWFVTPDGMTMIILRPGGFRVSVPRTFVFEQFHPVIIDSTGDVRNYWYALSTLEVTNEQFDRFVPFAIDIPNNVPSKILPKLRNAKAFRWIDNPSVPATRVPWFYAMQYCNWLTTQELGKERVGLTDKKLKLFTNDEDGMSVAESMAYRLPLEEEWELACRAGSRTCRFFGQGEQDLQKFAWFTINATQPGTGEAIPQPVGRKIPNRWGLFDMYGNASEWCLNFCSPDDFTLDPSAKWKPLRKRDPYGRVLCRPTRGGSCGSEATGLFSSNRHLASEAVAESSPFGGFRVARTFPDPNQ
jgi:formylglycine-generating enzyme required for sulfatase activity